MPGKITSITNKIAHLNRIKSVSWRRLLRVAPQVYLDYRSGRGLSKSLLNVTLEITYRCNARCKFCFAGKTLPTSERKELSPAEIGDIAQSVAPWAPGFFITGGEPFIRKDIIEVLSAIKKQRLKVGVNTNMFLVNEAMAQSLQTVGLDYLIASLHGPREIHDELVGVNSHDTVLEGIALLRRISPQTRILVNCVIIKENMDHLQQLVEEVAQAGAHALTLQHETFITEKEVNAHEHVWNSLFDDETPSPLSVPIQKTGRCNAKAIEKAVNTAQSYGTSVGLPVFVKPDLCEDALPSWYEGDFHPKGRCSYLYTDARINPYGDVVACQSLPLILGNIRQQSLPTIFNNEQSVRFRRALRSCGGNIPGCSRCCKLYRTF